MAMRPGGFLRRADRIAAAPAGACRAQPPKAALSAELSKTHSAAPMLSSLVTFLFRDKKVTLACEGEHLFS